MEDKELYNGGKVYDGHLIYCSHCKEPHTFTEYLDKEGGYLQKEVCDGCGNELITGNKSIIDTFNRCYYPIKCKCGYKSFVLTQPDRHPEYRTDVGIECPKCKGIIWIDLPVN